jgi:flagellar protein FlgJ
MDLNSNMMSVSAAQMQTRLEAAQSERILAQTQAAAGKAQSATQGAKTPAEKAAAMQKLEKVSKDFESIFIGYLLKSMRDTVPKSEFFGHSREQEIFGSMRDEEMAKGMSRAGGIGIAKIMVDQLKRQI